MGSLVFIFCLSQLPNKCLSSGTPRRFVCFRFNSRLSFSNRHHGRQIHLTSQAGIRTQDVFYGNFQKLLHLTASRKNSFSLQLPI